MAGFFSDVELTMVKPSSLVAHCGSCGLFKTCESPKMQPDGKGRKRVLIVAEAPGADEDRQGKPLVGRTGRRLADDLRKIGVEMRQDCWVTNAIICRPPDNEIPNDKVVGYCQPNLLRTISKLEPDVIITLGAVATQSLVGHAWSGDFGKFSRWIGWQIPSQKLNAWICPTWHPSYLLRLENKVADAYFLHHLKQAFKLKGKPWEEVPDYASQIDVVYDEREVCDWLDGITDGVIAFDYETNMLKPDSREAWIVSCSVCWNGEKTLAFPMHSKTCRSLRRLISDPNVKKIASNMKFEDRWTRKVLKTSVRGWLWDTMLAAHVIDCRRGITSIKFQSFIHLGQAKYDEHIEPYLKSKEGGGNSENRIKEIPMDQLLIYNGLDSLLEYLVAMRHREYMGCG